MKKIICFFLVFFICTLSSVAAIEETTEFYYEIKDGEAIINGTDNKSITSIIIPEEIKGYPVTAIGSGAFSSCRNLTDVIIPDSITRIGEFAFNNAESLLEIEIPQSVARIGEGAFENCDILTIYGEEGSTAHIYAKRNHIPFKDSKASIFNNIFFYVLVLLFIIVVLIVVIIILLLRKSNQTRQAE